MWTTLERFTKEAVNDFTYSQIEEREKNFTIWEKKMCSNFINVFYIV